MRACEYYDVICSMYKVFFSAQSGTRDSARGVCSLRVCGFESSSKKRGTISRPIKTPRVQKRVLFFYQEKRKGNRKKEGK